MSISLGERGANRRRLPESGKTYHSQRDLVAVLGQPFDVVGRITFVRGPLGRLGEVEQAIETDGRSEEGKEVISANSQILQRARWL
jgi:hypothetical protein